MNPLYVQRDNILGQWLDTDYRFCFMDNFVDKDPSDLTKEEIDLALSNTGCFTVGQGGFLVEIQNWLK
jgi:hypothetical protein